MAAIPIRSGLNISIMVKMRKLRVILEHRHVCLHAEVAPIAYAKVKSSEM